MLAVRESTQAEAVERLEGAMLQLPQADCPVVHHFGPGIYIREVTLPADTFAIGHEQRFEHLNIMVKGAVAIVGEGGDLKVLRAPLIYVGKPGRKVGYIIEETVWQNIYATTERDIDKLESMLLIKSRAFELHAAELKQLAIAARVDEREDFQKLLDETGFTAEQVRATSENTTDQIPMPEGVAPKITIRESMIEGKGVFLSSPCTSGELLAPARLRGYRTPVGRYTNHSHKPNAKFAKAETGDIYLVALHDIRGCCGGDSGEEVTIDYRQALSLSNITIGEAL
ncbi:MAG: Rhodoferax phage [Pseudomonadota bacterium]